MEFTADILNTLVKGSLPEYLGIQFTRVEANSLEATMPVDERTRQPHGILHGGASVALAETLGSVGSMMLIDTDRFAPVGVEINANHLRSKASGLVTGKAKVIHAGRKTHVWQIEIVDEENRLVCISRITVMIIEKNA